MHSSLHCQLIRKLLWRTLREPEKQCTSLSALRVRLLKEFWGIKITKPHHSGGTTSSLILRILQKTADELLQMFHSKHTDLLDYCLVYGFLRDHQLFRLLPSGRPYRSIHSHTIRPENIFFPKAVTFLNSNTLILSPH